MIPIEQILKVEQKARQYGYETTIINGGDYFSIDKDTNIAYGFKFQNDILELHIGFFEAESTISLEEHIKEQQQLLELAKILQVSEQKISKTMFDFNNDGTTRAKE